MQMAPRAIWTERYKNSSLKSQAGDDWLQKHCEMINSVDGLILDLGCGWGHDTVYLNQIEKKVVSFDFCSEVLRAIPKSKFTFSMAGAIEQLPFSKNSFQLIIANLSLHYFLPPTMTTILDCIEQILRPNGSLLVRVNSVKDYNYGSRGNMYEQINGELKVFYSKETFREVFNRFTIEYLEEDVTLCYGKPKHVIESKMRVRA